MKIAAFVVVIISTLGLARYTLDLNELVLKKLSWVDLRLDNAFGFVSSAGAVEVSCRLGRLCFLICGLVLGATLATAILATILGKSDTWEVWATHPAGDVFAFSLIAGIVFSAVKWSRQLLLFAIYAPFLAPLLTGCDMVREALTGKDTLELQRSIAHMLFFWAYDNFAFLNNKWIEGAFLLLISPIIWWAVVAVLLLVGFVFILFSLLITSSLARICAAIRWTTPSRPFTVIFAVLFVLSTAYLTFESELTH